MARPKTYERNDAIEKACRAFWEHGYGALGVRALEAKTGLNKFAIRSEFGGKEGLYLAALDYYHAAASDTVLAPLRDGGIEEIADFFQGLVTAGSINSSAWGCLMLNTGIENAEIGSEALSRAADAYWKDLQEHFAIALQNSRQAGDIKDDLDVDQVSSGLVAAVMGIHAKNRTAGAHNAGQSLVAIILNSLTSW